MLIRLFLLAFGWAIFYSMSNAQQVRFQRRTNEHNLGQSHNHVNPFETSNGYHDLESYSHPKFDTSDSRFSKIRDGTSHSKFVGKVIKGSSNIGILADKNAKEDLPQVFLKAGRKGGRVISLFSQTSNHPKFEGKRTIKNSYFSKQSAPLQIAAFAKTEKNSSNAKNMNNAHRIISRNGNGWNAVINSNLPSNPQSDHKKPVIYIRPGRQDGHLMSMYFNSPSPERSRSRSPSPTKDLVGLMEGQNSNKRIDESTSNDQIHKKRKPDVDLKLR